jgi:hypothetical protein
MQKTLIIIGIILIVTGVAWPLFDQIPLGRLPGDIIINKPNFRLYMPITTMILVSLLVSLILWIFKK